MTLFHQKEGRQVTRDGRYFHRILLQDSDKRFVFLVRKRHSIVGLVSTVLLC